MNLRTNIVVCTMMLAVFQMSSAVYNYEHALVPFSGKVERKKIDRRPLWAALSLTSARPPIELYGDLMARLLQIPLKDNRDISFEPSRSATALAVPKNTPIQTSRTPRTPCIIAHGVLIHLVDQMVAETQCRLESLKKSH